MKLSTQTSNIFGSFGEVEGLKVLKDAGYDALDMSLFAMSRDPACIYNEEIYREHAENLRRAADDIGIEFNQSHTPFNFNWKNPNEYEDVYMPMQIRALEISAILGAEHAVVHPWHYSQFMGHEDEIFEKNMDQYKRLLPYAKEYGIKIAIENMWQVEPKRKCIYPSACGTASELARYIDTLDDDVFVACLDLGHCGLVGEEPQDAIRILGHDRLKSLHIHDNDYRNDTHTLMGMSLMNWTEIAKALADIDYAGDFTLEADAFLRNFEKDFKPTACKFMVERSRYIMNKIEEFKAAK